MINVVNRISRTQLHCLVRPLDLLITQKIGSLEAPRVLCGLGGLDVVEEFLGTTRFATLDVYLRGGFNVTIRRPLRHIAPVHAEVVERYWLSTVSPTPKAAAFIPPVVLETILTFVARRVVSWALDLLFSKLRPPKVRAEVEYVRGLRQILPDFFGAAPASSITAAALLADDKHLETVGRLNGPVLADWRRRS